MILAVAKRRPASETDMDALRRHLRDRSPYVDALCRKIDRGHLGLVPNYDRKKATKREEDPEPLSA